MHRLYDKQPRAIKRLFNDVDRKKNSEEKKTPVKAHNSLFFRVLDLEYVRSLVKKKKKKKKNALNRHLNLFRRYKQRDLYV